MTPTRTPSGKPALTPLEVVAQIRDDAFTRGLKLAEGNLSPEEASDLRVEIRKMYETATRIESRYYNGLSRENNVPVDTFRRQLVTA